MAQHRPYYAEYYRRNRKRIIAQSMKWQAKNPEKMKLYRQRDKRKNKQVIKLCNALGITRAEARKLCPQPAA
jgi:hypothetical protein